MPIHTAAWIAEASKASGSMFTVCDFAFPVGTKRYALAGIGLGSSGLYEERVVGASAIKHGIIERPGQLGFPEMTITLANTDGALTSIIEGNAVRRSVATVRRVSPALASTDWATYFTGLLDRWEYGPATVDLTIRVDALPFDGFVPKQALLKGDAPRANNSGTNVWGTYYPIVYGTHRADALDGKGMLPTINFVYDATEPGYRYLVQHGAAKTVIAVYTDGVLKTYGVHYYTETALDIAGKRNTQVNFVSGQQPGTSGVVTCDIEGIETVGNGTGTLIQNPVAQLKHFLTNFVFAEYKTGNWLSTASQIDAASFADAEAFADKYGMKGSMYIGGTTEQKRALDIVNDWLQSWPCFRLYWTTLGKLACVALQPIISTATGKAWIRRWDEVGDSFRPQTQTQQLVSRVSAQYLYGVRAGKYWQSLDIEDVDAVEKVTESFSLLNSLASMV